VAFDPFGDGTPNSSDVANVTDKDVSTSWTTKQYPDGAVGQGTGLVLHAASPVAATLLQVRTPEPGFSIKVYGSRDSTPPQGLSGWHKLAPETSVEDKHRIQLSTNGEKLPPLPRVDHKARPVEHERQHLRARAVQRLEREH
jgi:hypothetical protein